MRRLIRQEDAPGRGPDYGPADSIVGNNYDPAGQPGAPSTGAHRVLTDPGNTVLTIGSPTVDVMFLVRAGGTVTVDKPTTIVNGTRAGQFALRSPSPVIVDPVDSLGNTLAALATDHGREWTVIPAVPGAMHRVRPC